MKVHMIGDNSDGGRFAKFICDYFSMMTQESLT